MWFTPFIAPFLEIIKRVIPDPAERQALEASLQQAAINADAAFAENQARVVVAEAQGESWMQRNWRPTLMFLLMGVLVWHMIPLPIIAALINVPLGEMVGLAIVPDAVWTLLTVGMGGYIGGRTLEKVMKK